MQIQTKAEFWVINPSRLQRGLWTMSKIERLARASCLSRFTLVVSTSDTLLVVSTLDVVQDCHLRPFYQF